MEMMRVTSDVPPRYDSKFGQTRRT